MVHDRSVALDAGTAGEARRRPDLVETSVGIAVCTHERNPLLERLLHSLEIAARRAGPTVDVGVVVVDDNPDGRARCVVEAFPVGSFSLGLHYRHTGSRNISVARNTGLEAALELGEWVGMVDDDEIATECWLEELVAVAQRTGAGAVTGPVLIEFPECGPRWLHDQPFATLFEPPPHGDGVTVPTCSTGNSIVRAEFLRENPRHRFRPELGETGGEDMVFYRGAIAAGLEARFAANAVCVQSQSGPRASYRGLLRICFWLGNSEFVTND